MYYVDDKGKMNRKENVDMCFKRKLLLLGSCALGMLIIGGTAQAGTASDNTQSFMSVYQTGVAQGQISDSKTEFLQKCRNELFPEYLKFIEIPGNNISFAEYAKENGYDQDMPLGEDTQTVSASDFSNSNSQNDVSPFISLYKRVSSKKVKIKAGDILVCHGTKDFNAMFLGHAAIATSSKYVLEMPGKVKGVSLNKNTRHYPLSKFFAAHTKNNSYVSVLRISKHPVYAKTASSYAWNKMYKNGKLRYSVLGSLYKKNPSYCSKYVYLAYWYGDHHKGMKGNLKWVFPYTISNVWKGNYRPSYIYKVTR